VLALRTSAPSSAAAPEPRIDRGLRCALAARSPPPPDRSVAPPPLGPAPHRRSCAGRARSENAAFSDLALGRPALGLRSVLESAQAGMRPPVCSLGGLGTVHRPCAVAYAEATPTPSQRGFPLSNNRL
jgi:hypothetical protein